MELLGIIRNYFVGRNVRQLGVPPIMEMDSGQPVVILSETKDPGRGMAKEGFFAEDAQNDKQAGRHGGLPLRENAQNDKESVVILSETKDLGRGETKERFFANDAQNDKIAGDHGRSPLRRDGCALQFTSSTTTWSPFSKEKAKGISALPLRVIILILMLLVVGVRPVVAQVPPTRLFINPTPLQIDTAISPSGVVTLEVADGVDIFAFDLFVQYDPALLSVSQVTLGGFLGEGLFCMDQINTPGLVHYNCTRFGVDTGVSGSGVLLELTFEAFGQPGDTPLLLTGSELYNWPDAFLVDATLEDGAVSVRPFRTYLPLLFSAGGQW